MTEDEIKAMEARAEALADDERGHAAVREVCRDNHALVAAVRRLQAWKDQACEDMRKAFGVSLKPPPKGLYENMSTSGIPRCPQCHRIVLYPDAPYCVGCKYVPPT